MQALDTIKRGELFWSVVQEIHQAAREAFGESSINRWTCAQPYPLLEDDRKLLLSFLFFHVPFSHGQTLAQWYSGGSDETRALLQAVAQQPYSVYKVVGEVVGEGFLLEDQLRGAEFAILLCQPLVQIEGAFVLAKLVEQKGRQVVLSLASGFLLDSEAETSLEKLLDGAEHLTTEQLLEPERAQLLFELWTQAREEVTDGPPAPMDDPFDFSDDLSPLDRMLNDDDEEAALAYRRHHERSIAWVFQLYLYEKFGTVSRGVFERDRNALQMAQQALNERGREYHEDYHRLPGTQYSDAVSCYCLVDSVELILHYVKPRLRARSKHWKDFLTSMRCFYRWMASRRALSPEEREEALARLGTPI